MSAYMEEDEEEEAGSDDDTDNFFSVPRRQHPRLWAALDSFQDLFSKMDEAAPPDEDTGPAVGEVAGGLICDADFFGWDFRGDRRVYQLFFTGSCDHFPAIWIGDYADGEDSEAMVEQVPVLYFMTDMDVPGEPVLQTHKNLREYLQDLIDRSSRATFPGAELDRLQAFVNTLCKESVDRGPFLPRLAE